MRIHLVFAIIAIVLSVILRISALEWCAIILCIVIVFALELINTSLESAVDLASPEKSDSARHAKDCAAAAVLIAAIGSVAVGLIVFIPNFISLIGS